MTSIDYSELPADVEGTILNIGDFALVIGTGDDDSGQRWTGHLVKITARRSYQVYGKECYYFGIEQLFANPGSTWGLKGKYLRRVEGDSSEFYIREAGDRLEYAGRIQARAEKALMEAETELLRARRAKARADLLC